MNAEGRILPRPEMPPSAVTRTILLPVGDLRLLKAATSDFKEAIIDVLKTEGETYRTLRTFRHGTKGRHVSHRELEVPKGKLWISISADARNFGPIDKKFSDLKAERGKTKESLS